MMRGSGEDKEKQTGQGPLGTQSGVCEVKTVMALCLFVQNMCLGVCVSVQRRAHVNTCAYLCGRMGPVFDKRGSVVKYGDER